MRPDLEAQFRAKTITVADAAALVRPGQNVYIGCCTSYARAVADAIAARSEDLAEVTIGCSNIIPPMSFLDCANPDAFRISTYFMGYEERRALKAGRADYTSVHLGQVDQWCRHTFHPDIAFFDVSLPDEEGWMSFGISGCCMHPFIQEETDNIVLQINSCDLLGFINLSGNALVLCEVSRIIHKGRHICRDSRYDIIDIFSHAGD